MVRWKCGVSRATLLACVASLTAPLPAMAAPFTANNGDTCANRGRDRHRHHRHRHRRPRRDSFRGNRDHLDCQWLQSFARAGRDHRQFRNDQRHRPRAIGTSGSSVPRHFTLWNRAGGLITASRNDAFQIGNDIGDGTVNVYNYGTILSTGGQGSTSIRLRRPPGM
jgi:hypothetical protein